LSNQVRYQALHSNTEMGMNYAYSTIQILLDKVVTWIQQLFTIYITWSVQADKAVQPQFSRTFTSELWV